MASSPRPESTPWKQSAERLQSAELAFAVRVADPQVQVATARESTLATEPETKPHSSDSAAAAAHSFAAPGPGTSVMPVTQTRDDARDNGSAAPSKTETASVSQSPETPTGSKKVDTGDPAPDTREAPVAKMQRPSLETTLASVPPVANSPARETEKVHQPQPAPEVHSLPDEPQAPTSQPVRDLSLRLSTPGQDKVEVKVVESAGEIRVAVRSTDPQLTSSLQEGISELTGRLESRGLQAETWRPSENSTPSSVTHSQSSSNNQQTFSDDGSQRRRGQQEQVLPSRRRNKPDWLREIDGTSNTLHNDITRRTS